MARRLFVCLSPRAPKQKRETMNLYQRIKSWLGLGTKEQACAVLHDAVEDNKKFTWEYLRSKHIPEECIVTLKLLTKVPGQTEEEYQVGVLSEVRAMRVKKRDLRHNSDIRRMKNREITEKDIERITKYMKFHARIEARLHELGTK